MRSPGSSASRRCVRKPTNAASLVGRGPDGVLDLGEPRQHPAVGPMTISHRLWPPKPSGSMRWRQARSSSAWVRTVGR